MPNYAVIDLGSNSIRLVVYRVPNDRRKSYSKRDFQSVANDKVMAGLAAYLDPETGCFTAAGIDKAVGTLKSHLAHAAVFKCKRCDIFATAVLRNAANSAEAIAAIEDAIDHPIVLLSGTDEAHLGFVGASLERSIDEGTLIDIGGGSTEITRVRRGKDVRSVSIPQGSLSSYASMVKVVLPTAAELRIIERTFDRKLSDVERFEEFATPVCYGIGGSTRAASKLKAKVEGIAPRPRELTRSDIDDLLALCADDPATFAHKTLAATADRVHTLAPGCAILDTAMRRLGAERIELCKCGLREGYLVEHMLR